MKVYISIFLISLASLKTASAQSEAHAVQFDLLKLENGKAIPQSFGDVPNKLDVSYRVLDKEGKPVELEMSFVDRPYRYSIFDLSHRWASASGEDSIAEIALIPQKGFQVTLRRLRVATFSGSHELKVRLVEEGGKVLEDRAVNIADRSPVTMSPASTSTKGLRFQWETGNGKTGLAAISVLLTPIDQQPFEPIVNSLGLTFEKVPGSKALVATTEVRVKDYAAFAKENPEIDNSWNKFIWEEWSKVFQTWRIPSENPDRGDINKGPLVEDVYAQQTPDDPVVNVNWEDANAFCRWLSKQEGRTYRLLTDHEWSCAAGIESAEDSAISPGEKSGKVRHYVWGTHFPPQDHSENLREFYQFKDDYPHTSPVTATSANLFGLYGLAGNVQELCEDTLAKGSFFKVVRGGGWRTNVLHATSSSRAGAPPFQRNISIGFRIALETEITP
ncbi:MAG: formylglycine-generating enzyme family protein [Planctomycetota bacterium]|jgi:hypothetical protein